MEMEVVMDATHPIWRTPAVQEAAAAEQFGAVIRMTRTARKLSLVRAGQLVGYSASTLSRIETGQRKLTDVRQLRRFADVLGIPPQLFGLTLPAGTLPAGAALLPSAPAPTTVSETPREGGDDPVRRRELLVGLVGVTGTAVFGAAARPATARAAAMIQELPPQLTGALQPVGVQVLARRLAAARATFQACRYQELAGILPSVIATARTSLDEASGERHDQTAALLADGYCLASDLCSRLHDDALAWVTAERARSAAQVSGDPASIAEAARMTSIAMRRHGHHDTATRLLISTALDLGADSRKPAPGLLASYGSLLCTGAYTAAQGGSRHQALELIGEAETAATRLGGTQGQHTEFSLANVTIYQIGVHTALGDAGTALDHARKISLRSLPTPERQARFCVDTARAWQRFGSRSNCFQALQTADRCAPEELRRSSVRSLVASLLDAPGPAPSGLREFAVRCGAVMSG
jgi:transcriptional regulator with XRE-family HTH domain